MSAHQERHAHKGFFRRVKTCYQHLSLIYRRILFPCFRICETPRTGDSLQYAFIIYENPRDCEQVWTRQWDAGDRTAPIHRASICIGSFVFLLDL